MEVDYVSKSTMYRDSTVIEYGQCKIIVSKSNLYKLATFGAYLNYFAYELLFFQGLHCRSDELSF